MLLSNSSGDPVIGLYVSNDASLLAPSMLHLSARIR